ncbi:MAG: PAS domain S-box protein [Campylobacterota bacterium]
MKRFIAFTMVVSILLFGVFYLFIDSAKQNEIDAVAQKQLQMLQKTYDTVVHMQIQSTQKDFEYLVMKNEQVLHLLQNIEKDKEQIRQLLYNSLVNEYRQLQDKDLRQLHFHLPSGESFLRFHQPSKYGDNLFSIRPSIQKANLQLQSFHGFEGGRVYPGFRNVFPIIYADKHLGSVEFSLPFEAIKKELYQILEGEYYQLLYSKQSTVSIVSQEFRENFTPAPISSNFTVEHSGIDSSDREKLSPQTVGQLHGLIKEDKNVEPLLQSKTDFYLLFALAEETYLANFIYVDTGQSSLGAYILSYEKVPQIAMIMTRYFYITLIVALATVLLTLAALFWQRKKVALEAAYQKIRSQSKFYTNLINNAPIAIYYKDLKGEYKECNSKFLQIFGFQSPQEVIGKKDTELFPLNVVQQYAEVEQELLQRQIQSKVVDTIGYDRQTQQVVKNLQMYKSIDLDQTKAKGYIGAIVDTSATKRTLMQLKKFYSASQYSPAIIVMTDEKGVVEYVNPEFCKVTGYAKQDVLAKSAYDLGNGDKEQMRLQIQQNGVYLAELINHKKDGSTYVQKTRIAPYYDEKKSLAGYISIGEDITKIKELEKIQNDYTHTLELQVSQKLKELRKKDSLLIQQSKMAAMGEMIGAIAHRWRQPLNALNINIQLLEDDYKDGVINLSYIEDFTQRMLEKIGYMDHTIDDFRNFFKPQKEKSYFSVVKSVEDTIALIDASYKASNIDIKMQSCDITCNAYGYQNEFNHVMVNILKNAKDAIVGNNIKKGNVVISVSCIELLQVTISDNAGGIEPQNLSKVFEPYFTTKDAKEGTGIGLYMSKVIIEQNMGGKIWIENTDIGAKVVMTLPLH